jgi:hypothetical protein
MAVQAASGTAGRRVSIDRALRDLSLQVSRHSHLRSCLLLAWWLGSGLPNVLVMVCRQLSRLQALHWS